MRNLKYLTSLILALPVVTYANQAVDLTFPEQFYNIPTNIVCDNQNPFIPKVKLNSPDLTVDLIGRLSEQDQLESASNFNAWRLFLGVNADVNNPKALQTNNNYTPRWGTWISGFNKDKVQADDIDFSVNALKMYQAKKPYCGIELTDVINKFKDNFNGKQPFKEYNGINLPTNFCDSFSYTADGEKALFNDSYDSIGMHVAGITSKVEMLWPDLIKQQKPSSNDNWQCSEDCIDSKLNLKHSFLNDSIDGSFIIDKNNSEIYYEVRYNPIIMQSYATQIMSDEESPGFKSKFFFPQGSCNTEEPQKNVFPSIVIKYAWKTMQATDIQSDFFVMKGVTVPNKTQPVDLGLVAMHITTKENGFTTWRWATFEHNSLINESDSNNEDSLFYSTKDAPAGMLENSYGITTNNIEKVDFSHVISPKLTRLNEINAATKKINTFMQQQLSKKRSIFANYQLVGTQYYELEKHASKYVNKPNYSKLINKDLRNLILEAYITNQLTDPACKIAKTTQIEKIVEKQKVFYQCANNLNTTLIGCMSCHNSYEESDGKGPVDSIFSIKEFKNKIISTK